jgi:hypothetical protein
MLKIKPTTLLIFIGAVFVASLIVHALGYDI